MILIVGKRDRVQVQPAKLHQPKLSVAEIYSFHFVCRKLVDSERLLVKNHLAKFSLKDAVCESACPKVHLVESSVDERTVDELRGGIGCLPQVCLDECN